MKLPPCIIGDDSPDPDKVTGQCGRPRKYMDVSPVTIVQWFARADSGGTITCPECLSIVRNAVEESERRAKRGF